MSNETMDVPAGPGPVKPRAEPRHSAFGVKRKNGVKNFSPPGKLWNFSPPDPEFPKNLGENEKATPRRRL